MPPKAGVKKPRAPKGYKLAKEFPPGEILKDVFKKEWKLGPVIGQGGFGLIYLASDDLNSPVSNTAEYVVKIEPKENGPLFCELSFYQRCCKADMVDAWLQSHKLKYLGIPRFIGSGIYTFGGKEYRFMVMQRFSTDLQKLFEKSKCFPPSTVLCIGLRMLDCLEYLHENEYVHGDVKAANILLGYRNGKTVGNEVYLVDYGLAFRYNVENNHKIYKKDPKRAHDGTVEFTSRDAHEGYAPSRRGDLEILGYCLLQWLCGRLPWEDKLTDKDYVRDSKKKSMKNIPSLMKTCSAEGEAADAVSSFLSAIVKLDYEEKPNYNSLRKMLLDGLKKLGVKDEWKIDLNDELAAPSKPAAAKAKKRKGDDPDEEHVTSPNKKMAGSKSVSNGRKNTTPSARRGRPIVTSPSSRSRASPGVKRLYQSPKLTESIQSKGAKPRKTPKKTSKKSPKKTTKNRSVK